MTSIEFITSNKGKPLLVLDSYVYQLNKSTAKVKYWSCEVKGCFAAVHTDSNNQFLKKRGEHEAHLPSPESIEVRKLKKLVKDRVTQETTPIGQIFEDELVKSQLSQTALVVAPTAEEASKLKST
jgi:hypothetical protein